MRDFPHLFFGTTREHYMLLFGTAGCFALLFGFIGAWIGARFAARGAARTVLVETDLQRGSGAELIELRQLAQNIEAIGLEVERIAEAQRFVAKVLVERGDPKLAAVVRHGSGNVTPH